ncbi:MAG: hypothetical protein ABSA84_06040 [Gammaproteobacteria bacterium]
MKIKNLLQLFMLIFPLISLGDNLINQCEEEFVNIFEDLAKPEYSFEKSGIITIEFNSQKAIATWEKKKDQCSRKGFYKKKLAQMQCQAEFNLLWQDDTLKSWEQKFESFRKLQSKCSIEGVFEANLADLYLMYNFANVGMARDMLIKAINNEKYSDIRYLEVMLAHLDYSTGNAKELYKTALKLIKKYPYWWRGYYYLGLYYFDQNDLKQAEKLFFQSIEKRENFIAYMGLTIVFYEYEYYKQVIEFHRKGFKINIYKTLQSMRAAAAVIIAFVKENDLKPAGALIGLIEEHNKEAAQKSYAYQIARRYYEDTVRTGVIPDKAIKIELDPPK